MNGVTFYFNWEVDLISWIQSFIGPVGVKAANVASMFGEELILIMIFGLLYWCIDKKTAKVIATNLMVALVLNPMMKNLVLRRRPYFDNEIIKCLRPVDTKADLYDIAAQGYSFPSAHTMNSTVIYGSFVRFLKNPVLRIISVIIPICVGVSRFALGNHYPTDVLVGALAGVFIVVFVPYFEEMSTNKNVFHLVVFILALSGVFFCRTEDYYSGLGVMAGFFLAVPFEERFVNFEETRNPLKCILRIFGGIGVYLIFNTLLKLPFSKEFLESGLTSAYLVRSFRYAIVIFLMLGLYPMIFGKIHGRRKKVAIEE